MIVINSYIADTCDTGMTVTCREQMVHSCGIQRLLFKLCSRYFLYASGHNVMHIKLLFCRKDLCLHRVEHDIVARF